MTRQAANSLLPPKRTLENRAKLPNGRNRAAALRRHIAHLERADVTFESGAHSTLDPLHSGRPSLSSASWRFGVKAIDAHLPPLGMSRNGLHEFTAGNPGHGFAATGLALALLRRFLESCQTRSPLLWCTRAQDAQEDGMLYGPGLKDLGLDPARFVFVTAKRDKDVLWVLEEGLRAKGLAAVIGEVQNPSFTATRRLALASQNTQTPSLLLCPYTYQAASAALTKWQVDSIVSTPPFLNKHAPGHPAWRLTLKRARGGQSGVWDLEWNYETGDFHLLTPLADRMFEAGEPERTVLPFRRSA